MAGSDGTPARVELPEKFDQPAGAGTWAASGIEASPQALAILAEQGVDAWRAFVRRDVTKTVMGRSEEEARPWFPGEKAALAVRSGNPGALRRYWTAGPGLAKWRGSPTPWRTLRKFLSKYLSGDELDSTTSSWYRLVFGKLPQDR
jgi:hypothetical protein